MALGAADASSKSWFGQSWKAKIAAGFSNTASMSGDKGVTITYFVTWAVQHGVIWIGTRLMPANSKNYVAGAAGALTTSPSDASAEEAPNEGNLETGRLLARRVAEHAVRTRG